MMLRLTKFEAESAVLPCGCAVHGTKVYANGRRLDCVVSVESFRPERNSPWRDVLWHVTQQVENSDGSPRFHEVNGHRERAFTVAEMRNIELRCKHHPEFGS